MKWLLLHGSSVDERDYAMNTVFHAMSRNGHVELLRSFIAEGFDVMSAVNNRQQTIVDTALHVEDKTRQQTHSAMDSAEHERYVKELHVKKRGMLCFLIEKDLMECAQPELVHEYLGAAVRDFSDKEPQLRLALAKFDEHYHYALGSNKGSGDNSSAGTGRTKGGS